MEAQLSIATYSRLAADANGDDLPAVPRRQALDQDVAGYGVKKHDGGGINEVNPGVFFYFTQVNIISTAGTMDEVSILQSATGGFREFEIRDATVYSDPSCTSLLRVCDSGTLTDCVFELELTGSFIIRVRYDSQSIRGFVVCPGLPSSTYTFETRLAGALQQTDSLVLSPKPSAKCP